MKKYITAIIIAFGLCSCNNDTNRTDKPVTMPIENDSSKIDTAVMRTTVPVDSGYREGGSYQK